MSEYPSGSREDRESLSRMAREDLLDSYFLQVRNIWRVDGLYFLGIERRLGTEAATDIDAEVWKAMATIEAKALRRLFEKGERPGVGAIVGLLRKSSWAMDQPFKSVEVEGRRAILSIERCRTQETRLRRGLGEFPCKKVRLGYLQSFAKALNPDTEVGCLVCPPDKHPKDLWCRWEFKL